MQERRKHKRYTVTRGVFAILRSETDYLGNIEDMSMGEIAIAVYKAGPEKIGQIKNIGMGGLAFDYVEGNGRETGPLELDILMTEKGIYLHSIPHKIIMDTIMDDEINIDMVNMKRLSIMFTDLSKTHKESLTTLITDCQKEP